MRGIFHPTEIEAYLAGGAPVNSASSYRNRVRRFASKLPSRRTRFGRYR
jgi:hypothetical protein